MTDPRLPEKVSPRLKRLASFLQVAYPPAAKWVGLAGMVYGGIKGNVELIYTFAGLTGSSWAAPKGGGNSGNNGKAA